MKMKNNPKVINNFKFGMVLLVGAILILLLAGVIMAKSYSRTSFNHNYGANIDIAPVFNEDSCEAGQDFLIQVAPLGCDPLIVRSDLLEEQNVPVFCQLAATKLNPLIEVEAIDHISFKGDYPEEVSGVGFHPARAALKSSQRKLLNSPILGNIGYAVIVLKEQKNESAMPDWVEGTLTANIKYDIKNAFGVGKAVYHLPEMSDDDWERRYTQYGFWRNKGYLRVEGVDAEGATVSVYRDADSKIATVNLDKGETSRSINLPGFYCQAGMKLKLNDLKAPDTRAKLEINGEIFEVAEKEKLLDNLCTVKKVEKEGLVQKVTLSCKGDEKKETLKLERNPRVEIEFNGKRGIYTVGDVLDDLENVQNKKIFVGYVGENEEGSFNCASYWTIS